MKECRDCEYFEGYDYSDGMPYCTYKEDDIHAGYEYCPFNDVANIKNNGFKIEIDTKFISDYITHTLVNSADTAIMTIAQAEIKRLIESELKETVLEEMKLQIKDVVSQEIQNFMNGKIQIGGGWNEPLRELSRNEYLTEVIEKQLSDVGRADKLKDSMLRIVNDAIHTFEGKLRDQINTGIKTYFNEATRQTLTDNVVSMLMCNDTYKNLQESMQTFLPEKEKE